jgi:hypothetical protein
MKRFFPLREAGKVQRRFPGPVRTPSRPEQAGMPGPVFPLSGYGAHFIYCKNRAVYLFQGSSYNVSWEHQERKVPRGFPNCTEAEKTQNVNP